jgi:predicted phosphodiesterase
VDGGRIALALRDLQPGIGVTLKIQETLLAVLSDMHTGSSTALFPRSGYQGPGTEDNLIKPNDRQLEIHPVFVRFAGEVATARKGKRLIIVNLGDAIDGFHHGSMQESLFKENDQCAAHVLLMSDFMKRAGFDKKKGDELYYVRGTEAHVKDSESDMARELGAVRAETGLFVNEVLELNVNGLNHLFLHHGKARGRGVNEGNALRNYLRDTRDEREKDGLSKIDVLWSGHTHGHMYESHIKRITGGNYHVFHGVICPSWQAKTRFAYGKVPSAVNSVGGVYAKIGVDGTMGLPRFVVQCTRDG